MSLFSSYIMWYHVACGCQVITSESKVDYSVKDCDCFKGYCPSETHFSATITAKSLSSMVIGHVELLQCRFVTLCSL